MTSIRDGETEVYRLLEKSGFSACSETPCTAETAKAIAFRHRDKNILKKCFVNVQSFFEWLIDLKNLSNDYAITQYLFRLSSDSVYTFSSDRLCTWKDEFEMTDTVGEFCQQMICDNFAELVKVNGADKVNDVYRWICEHTI